MKAAIWVRVSTADQTTENQIAVLERLCEARGFEIVRRFNVTASAWDGTHDPAIDELIASASHGDFSVLVCWALDRLERRGGEVVIELLARLAQRKVSVVSYTESWVEEMRDPMTMKFLAFMAGWVAEAESRRRSERTRAGLERKAREGWRPGRTPGRKDTDPTEDAERAAAVRQRRSDGQRLRWAKARRAASQETSGVQPESRNVH